MSLPMAMRSPHLEKIEYETDTRHLEYGAREAAARGRVRRRAGHRQLYFGRPGRKQTIAEQNNRRHCSLPDRQADRRRPLVWARKPTAAGGIRYSDYCALFARFAVIRSQRIRPGSAKPRRTGA